MIVSIGIDLHDTRRLNDIIQKHGKKFLDRIFTSQEQLFCEKRTISRHLAYGKTFAAKEATLKALQNVEKIRWHDIEILRLSSGRPVISLYAQALLTFENLTNGSQTAQIHLSLSDEDPYAQAFVVIST